jgi:ABC-type phosphate transport system auxiliary subunit
MDTLHAYETLRGKFDEDTAKTLVEAIVGLVTPSFADLATKTDIHDVKAEIEQLRLATKADIQEVKAGMEQLRLSTKADIEQLRLATEAQIDRVKTEVRTEIQDVKADLRTTTAELRADMQGIKAELIRWLFGAALAIVSAMGIMLRLVR